MLSCQAIAATIPTTPARAIDAPTSTCRRRHRSSSTPANGPTIVYGSSSTVKVAAAELAVPARSGEKKTNDASATWNMPSAACDAIRVRNSFRKSACRSTVRSSAAEDTA